jgi:hypothetical protein
MSWVAEAFAAMKRIVQLDSDVARLDATIGRIDATVADHEKRRSG